MKTRNLIAACSVIGMLGLLFACGNDDLLQGNGYVADPVLATGDPTVRTDSGLFCDGDVCAEADAPFDGPPLPVNDADVEPMNTCQTARLFGTIAGDQGAETAMTTGTCAEYVSLRVGEEDSNTFGVPMKTKLTLNNTLANFDMYVFFDPNADDLQCSMPYAKSVTASTTQESVSLTWGEGTIANGKDDGRTVVIAVVKADGPCGTGSWTLLAEGNK